MRPRLAGARGLGGGAGHLVLGLWAAVALAPGGGCKRGGGAVAARPLRLLEARVGGREPGREVVPPDPSGRPVIDEAALAVRAVERLRGAGAEVALGAAPEGPASGPGGSAERDLRLRLDISLGATREGDAPVLQAAVKALLQGAAGGRAAGGRTDSALRSDIVAERRFAPGSLDAAAARAHLERAVDDALAPFLPMVRLRAASADELIAALEGRPPAGFPAAPPPPAGGSESPAASLPRQAARELAERRERLAVPALIALLRASPGDRGTRDAALGALMAIGDERAVKPITELAKLDDAAQLPVVIDAVAAIGGAEARAYLEFLASADGDPALRAAARAGLERMAARVAGAGRDAG